MGLLTRKLLRSGQDIGDVLIATDQVNKALTSIDVKDPDALALYDDVTLSFYSSAIAIDHATKIAYVGEFSSGTVSAYSFENPKVLTSLDSLLTSVGVTAMALDEENKVLYCVGSSARLSSFDVSDPLNITELDAYQNTSLMNGPQGVALDLTNSVAYVACGLTSATSERLTSIDISDPEALSYIGTLSLGEARDVVLDVVNEVAYVADNSNDAIVSVDISTPATMVVLDTLTSLDLRSVLSLDIDLVNEVVYTASNVADTFVSIDVSDPSAMAVLDAFSDTGQLNNPDVVVIDAVDDVAYVGSTGLTYRVTSMDISDPSAITYLDHIEDSTLFSTVKKLALYKEVT